MSERVSLEQIEKLAHIVEASGRWQAANWVRSQAQEIQIELERELDRIATLANTERGTQ